MKKTILNFAAVAVIATSSFIACDKKQANQNNTPADSAQVDSAASTVIDSVSKKVDSSSASVKETVKNAAGEVKDAAKDAANEVKDAAKNAAGDVKDAANDVKNKVTK
ncbi:hypothetical protein [Apibacter adventoris]|uniref:YtxH domain-containing protein n=1 Tax=Apibacter adventoris TaxID=1679466 RepID=A0A2S8AFV9_9FLAO|nr:hypothetical protein [Apibacter adventoris]PQL93404.1 hypothetical protein C4S76_09245 [Apibacter adventoris]PQL95013.1 hypothetical protein C4S77_02020 [Apibacter adventoris]